MACVLSKKKRKDEVIDIDEESEAESSTSEEEDGSDSDVSQLEIQVEFEARNPAAADFYGIKRLLQQLLLKSNINLSEITDLILNQSKVGSVLKCVEEEVPVEEDDDNDNDDETYGISTVLNLRHHKVVPSIQDFVKLLVTRCQNEKFLNILKDDRKCIGWLISERFINIPPHIAPPLYATLRSEITKACNKGQPFHFDYLLYMCKSCKIDNSSRKKKKKNTETQETKAEDIMFINAEDEILHQKATEIFEFDVSDEADMLLSGKWRDGDEQMRPYRTVMLIPWEQMERICTEMEQFVS